MGEHDVVPGWIYGLAEYQQIFALEETDLTKSILDFPGSIGSFNAEMQAKGRSVTSGDAIYNLSFDAMQVFAEKLFQANQDNLRAQPQLLQDAAAGFEETLSAWEMHKALFLADYAKGISEKRYQSVLMPHLPYQDHQFQLALCSDYVFHRFAQNDCTPENVVAELCRVAEEVRVFPLLDDAGDVAASLGPLMLEMQQNNYGIEIRQVPFEVLKGGNAMLRIWATECLVTE